MTLGGNKIKEIKEIRGQSKDVGVEGMYPISPSQLIGLFLQALQISDALWYLCDHAATLILNEVVFDSDLLSFPDYSWNVYFTSTKRNIIFLRSSAA